MDTDKDVKELIDQFEELMESMAELFDVVEQYQLSEQIRALLHKVKNQENAPE